MILKVRRFRFGYRFYVFTLPFSVDAPYGEVRGVRHLSAANTAVGR